MVTQQLLDYIKQQLQTGKSKEQISQELINGGWQAVDVEQGFANLNMPNPGIAPVPQAPSIAGPLPSVGSLFSESFALMKERILVIFVGPLLLILGLIGIGLVGGILVFIIYKAIAAAGVIIGIILGIAFIAAWFYAIYWSASAQLTALRDAEEKTGIMENLKRSRAFAWSLLLVSLIGSLILMGGMVLLVIPGIIFLIYYMFAPAIMITENKKGRIAVAQSKAYVYGKWWKVFGRVLLLYVLYFVPYLLLQVGSSVLKGSWIAVVCLILLFFLQFFFSFYVLAFTYTLYKQLKNSAGATNPEQYVGGVTGWTIWGAVGGVLVFVGLFASVVLLSLNSARAKYRDAKRMADVRQVASAVELYFNDYNSYPSQLSGLVSNYIGQVPPAPQPPDGSCTADTNEYHYQLLDKEHYQLTFCLGGLTGGYKAGIHTLSEQGLDTK